MGDRGAMGLYGAYTGLFLGGSYYPIFAGGYYD